MGREVPVLAEAYSDYTDVVVRNLADSRWIRSGDCVAYIGT